MMAINLCSGGKDLRITYATLSTADTLLSFDCPRFELPLRYSIPL